jgi:peptide/nickel transport system permease protein
MVQKFLKNKLGIFGFLFISILVIVATLGYTITPDSTPRANDSYPELKKEKPGFKVQFLRQGEPREITKRSWLGKLIYGQEVAYNYIPVAAVAFPDSFARYTKSGLLLWEQMDKDYVGNDREEDHVKSRRYLLGTDDNGRDLLSRLIIGARVSLIVGFASVLISLIIGITLGLISGYFGGWVDTIVLWFINVIWSLPSLLIAFAIIFALGNPGIVQVIVVIGLSMWVELARIVRGQVLQIKEMEYIQAAKVLGFSDLRILFKHILPNIIAPVIVVCAANFAAAILLEAGLSFLGLGVQIPTPSWGAIINNHYKFITTNPQLALIPGFCIMLLVMSFNFVGNALRDVFDVNLKS